jgi:hypothetical protein
MAHLLAYAEPTDLSGSDWQVVLIALAVIAGVGVLAVVPIGVARRRGSRWAAGIAVASLLWGLGTAGSLIQTAMAQRQWVQTMQLDLRTGYGDPHSRAGAPGWPWGLWLVLAGIYAVLLGAGWWRRGGKSEI